MSVLKMKATLRACCFLGILGLGLLSTPAQVTQESEPNDTPATASGQVTAGIFVQGTTQGAGDVDAFSYWVPGAGKLSIGVHGPRGATYSWQLRNSLGNLVAESNTGSRPELLTLSVPTGSEGDLHTIEVRRESLDGPPTSSSAYSLGVAYISTAPRPTKPGTITNYFLGSSSDSANEPVQGPGIMLMGGGSEVDNQFRDHVWPRLNRGNIVVVRTGTSSGYQDYFYTDIPGLFSAPVPTPGSVETLVINSTTKANSDYTSWAVSRAELVWFAGGDQSDYVNYYKGTALEQAVHQAYMRGAVVGGTSAGAMILGQYVYDPDGVTAVTSAQAVANPYHPSVLLTTDFFEFPIMKGLLVETHTKYGTPSNPQRLGRLAAMMARVKTDLSAPRITGIAPDDSGGIFITSNRIATADRSRYTVWILAEDSTTDLVRCLSGQSLIYNQLIRWRAAGTVASPSVGLGQDYDLETGTKTGGARVRVSVNDSVYTPADWYEAAGDDGTAPVVIREFLVD